MFEFLSDSLVAKIIAVNACLAGVAILLKAFLPADNKFVIVLQKIVDFCSANIKHK